MGINVFQNKDILLFHLHKTLQNTINPK